MAEDSKLPNIGGNGFIWILLVAAGTYFVAQHQVPLQGSRPASTQQSIPERVGEQHIDARLWQDPFAAVADYLAKSPSLKPENCAGDNGGNKDIETYCRPPLKRPATARVLVVSASGSPYSEDQEARRRKRYAVLAGLSVEGFEPDDPQHIGFFWPDATTGLTDPDSMKRPEDASLNATAECSAVVGVTCRQPSRSPPSLLPVRARRSDRRHASLSWLRHHFRQTRAELSAAPSPRVTLPKTVPYEWFRRYNPDTDKAEKEDRILLLWFDEDALAAKAPLQQFAKLLCPYLQPADKLNVKILGPQLSTTLKAMVDQVNGKGWSKDDWSGGICPNSAPPQFYVSDATASDVTLIPNDIYSNCHASDTCLRNFFHANGIALYRLIATDEALARTVSAELALRGVDQQYGNDHIALISEWDTLYGRALPDAMARCLGQATCKLPDNKGDADSEWPHRYKYLRGLDGQMPNAAGLDSGNGAKDSDNKPNKDSKDSSKNRPDPSTKDRAEGQGQYDYLRRLGDRLLRLDAELRSRDRRGIEAVGVLGSDVYDKLLVLQALRSLFPDAWFFTTDLDALLLHPDTQTPTRNLLVASSFGLQLRDDIQREIPPFRSSYQTAEFLAARVAIHSNDPPPPCWSNAPLLFEIGSSHEFQFAGAALPDSDACEVACEENSQLSGSCAAARSEIRRADHDGCKKELTNCRLIQPDATPMLPQLSARATGGLAGVGLVGLSLVCFPCIRLFRRRDQDGTQSGPPPIAITAGLVGLGVVTILGVTLVMAAPLGGWLTQGGSGQPIMLREGISLWPTIFLRLATLLLCIWLLLFSLDMLGDNLKQIENDLHLKQMHDDLEKTRPALVAAGPPLTRLARRFGYLLPDVAGDDVLTFWRKYFYRGRRAARFVRVIAGVAVMGALWRILVLIFGNPQPPTRGNVSAGFYHVVTPLLFLATLFLIFFVADATWQCWRLTRDIRTPTVVWPERTLEEFSKQYGLPRDVLGDCIDLIFVAKRSKCITTLLYGPFLVIALIVVSHSPVLVNYGRSIPDVITMAMAVLIVTACGVALRLSAETTRAEARRRLTGRLMIANGEHGGAQVASQLELLLRRIEELREGAFSPFSQQPLVRAMLLPLGSFGGTALLGILLGPGFG